MKITSACLSDIPALCRLLDVLFTQEIEFAPNHEAQIAGLAAIISNPDIGQVIVARQDENIVGMLSLLYTISTALGGRVALLEDMVVASSARGTGVGTKILNYAIDVAKKSGCKRITLLTDETNEAAQRFYIKQGFLASSMRSLRLRLGEKYISNKWKSHVGAKHSFSAYFLQNCCNTISVTGCPTRNS